jgi:hypothetical protein
MTPTEIQRKALLEVGDLGENALYELRLPLSVSAGSYPLTFAGLSTGPIAFNAAPEEVKEALEALDNIRAGNVDVWGARRGPYRIAMIGEMGETALPVEDYPFTGVGTGLTPAGAVTVTQIKKGYAPSLAAEVITSYTSRASKENQDLILLYVKLDLYNILVPRAARLVDTNENEVDRKLRQKYLNLKAERDLVQNAISAMEAGNAALTGTQENFRIYTGQIIKRTPNNASYGKMVRMPDGTYR